MRGFLSNVENKPQFSGHETFPLRQLWLKKACDAVGKADRRNSGSIFSSEKSIVEFGVGKNMVTSMRHWALACGFLAIKDDALVRTELCHRILGGDLLEVGLDPYLEHPSSAWIVHWVLASHGLRSATWYWVFNHIVQPTFDREHLLLSIKQFIESRPTSRLSESTLKRDIECFIRSYVPRLGGESPEDIAEPILGELGLMHEVSKGTFAFRRGPKHTLSDGLFAYALLDFWERFDLNASSLSFGAIAHEYGSPGRVFKLDENAVADRLMALDSFTKGCLVWTDVAGMRQVSRLKQAAQHLPTYKMKLLSRSYD